MLRFLLQFFKFFLTASWAILLIGALQIILLSWVYGFENSFELIKEMGMKIPKIIKFGYWWPMWMAITPLYTVAIHIFILAGIGPTQFRGYVFPWWAGT